MKTKRESTPLGHKLKTNKNLSSKKKKKNKETQLFRCITGAG